MFVATEDGGLLNVKYVVEVEVSRYAGGWAVIAHLRDGKTRVLKVQESEKLARQYLVSLGRLSMPHPGTVHVRT